MSKYKIEYQCLNQHQSEDLSSHLNPWTEKERHTFNQVHGKEIKIIQPTEPGDTKTINNRSNNHNYSNDTEPFDGGLVFHRGVVMIKTADCIPILLHNHEEGWVAALHCGWRSIQKGIINHFFTTLKQTQITNHRPFNPAKIHAIIGPGICENCYEVRSDLIDDFTPFFLQNPYLSPDDFFIKKKGQKNQYLFNLKKLITKVLHNNTISIDNIEVKAECTYEDVNFNSHRENKTPKRNISFIGIH